MASLTAGFATPLEEFWLTILGTGLTLSISLILSRGSSLPAKHVGEQ